MSEFFDRLGNSNKLSIIAGPCVYENRYTSRAIALELNEICKKHDVNFCFKMSFDKANRSSYDSYRGDGMLETMKVFRELEVDYGIECITDIHEKEQATKVNTSLLQIPAFLCRQTDLITTAARTNKPVAIKKGQFLSPLEMKNVVDKVRKVGNNKPIVIERGTTFGYNDLVVDMRSLEIMKNFDCPVIFDATHSVQKPGANGTSSNGQRQFAFPLARAATSIGIAGIFMEVHPEPWASPSDGANMIELQDFESILMTLLKLDGVVK